MGNIRRMQITYLIQDKKISIFLQINYNVVFWKIYIISATFFMWIITYKNKGLKPVFFFLKNVKDFKLNYYVQHRNSKITKHVSKDTILVGFFGVSDDQNCPLRILLEFLVWGPTKLFWKVLTKINFFFANYSQWRTY
jgi:hypothetical protein